MPSQPSEQEQPTTRRRVLTLVIASASSMVAAMVVSRIWGPGTLFGAAATPIIITLLGDLMNKPAERITAVRVSAAGTEVHERPASEAAGRPSAVAGEMSQRSVHRSRRRPAAVALATGLLAFTIGATVLTVSELVVGDGSVASGDRRTTVFGGPADERSSTQQAPPATGPTATMPPASTVTETQTTTVPVPPASTAPPADPGATPPVSPGETAPSADPVPPAGPTSP